MADDRGADGTVEETLEADTLDRVVAMLRHADPDEVDVWEVPPPDLEDQIVARIRAEEAGRVVDLEDRRSAEADRARRRAFPKVLLAAAAAVVALVLAFGVFSFVDGGSNGSDSGSEVADPAEPNVPTEPTVGPLELAGQLPGVTGSVALVQGEQTTELHLVASGLTPDQVYAAWLAPAEGERVPAGTFRTDENGDIEADLVSSYPLSSAARVWVTDPADTTVLKAPLT